MKKKTFTIVDLLAVFAYIMGNQEKANAEVLTCTLKRGNEEDSFQKSDY